MKNKSLAIAALILIAALLIVSVFNAAKAADYTDWRSTEGRVTDVVPGRHLKTIVHFIYEVDGMEYSSSVALRNRYDSIPQPGADITVWHDGKDFSRAALDQPEVTAFDSLAPLFPVSVLIIGVILASGKRQKPQQ